VLSSLFSRTKSDLLLTGLARLGLGAGIFVSGCATVLAMAYAFR
jgi:hypothetical protein